MRTDRLTSLTFLLSVGLAVAMHGAALAFAVYWQGPELEDAPADTIAVELIDAAEWEAAASADRLAASGTLKSDTMSEPAAPEVGATELSAHDKPESTAAARAVGLHDGEEPMESLAASPSPTDAEPAPVETATGADSPSPVPVGATQSLPIARPLAPAAPSALSAATAAAATPTPQVATAQTTALLSRKVAGSAAVQEKKPTRRPRLKATAPTKPLKTAKSAAAKGGGKDGKAANGFANVPSASLASYRATVNQRIRSRRPSGLRAPRPATVAFAIAPSGALRYASISASSGNVAFDSAVLAAVRRSAPFPPPPKGTSPAQLRFEQSFSSR